MPHKFYHGKTGRVYNVTKSALGVMVNKQVRYGVVSLCRIYFTQDSFQTPDNPETN